MKKFFFPIIVFLFMVASCNQSTVRIPEINSSNNDKIVERLTEAYSLTSFDVAPSKWQSDAVLNTIREDGRMFKKFRADIDEKSIRISENKNENIAIAMMTFKSNSDKMYAVKGSFIKGAFYAGSELVFGRKLTDANNGQIVMVKDQEALMIDVRNGHEIITSLFSQDAEASILNVADCQGNHGGTGFCQREPGESFSACYNAEKAEFCNRLFFMYCSRHSACYFDNDWVKLFM